MRLLVLASLVLAGCGSRSTPRHREEPRLGPEEIEPSTALAAGACDDVPRYTLAELAAGKGDRERIAVDVTPAAHTFCTEMYCPDSACCNQCGGGYGARLPGEPELELRLEGLAGCAGMDCNLHCEPFGRKPTKSYRFVGVNTFTPAGKTSVYHQAALKVERYCRI